MLQLDRVVKVFNEGTVNEKLALDGVSLDVGENDFVTVIGGNGAGKSTLLNVICGLHAPTSGTVSLNVDGVEINLSKMLEHKRAKYFGRVFQDPMMGTAATMEIQENLALAMLRGDRRNLSRALKKKEASFFQERLAQFDLGLETRMSSKVGLLSGGQRQALTLLMATLRRPRLLLLDEHTAALDPKTAAKVMEITCELTAEQRIPAVMITHNMKDAIKYGNRLIMMNEGQIIYDVSGEEKSSLHVRDLLLRFEQASGGELANDRLLLA
ncbi:MAG: ATP-binding cassette domain-containing protein [Clostridiales bacterium]|jgi:putative ABC transport system ATP-binding protein|nr:ATP-binding cassette domain-containing protein [Clostridiales bacterium]